MRTHENADPNNAHAQVDFCWDAQYIQMNSVYSDVYNNENAAQAWRAGFREGVKLATDRGVRITPEEFKSNHWRCLHWLYIWTMVGADVDNGLWAIYGAREGLYKTMCTDIPIAEQPLDANQSKFFKSVYQNPSRTDNQRFIEELKDV
jgi:hypothetical protein